MSEKKLTSREDFQRVVRRRQEFTVKGLGTVILQEISSVDAESYDHEIEERAKRVRKDGVATGDQLDQRWLRAMFVARHLVNEEGDRIFGDDDDSLKQLAALPMTTLFKLRQACWDLDAEPAEPPEEEPGKNG